MTAAKSNTGLASQLGVRTGKSDKALAVKRNLIVVRAGEDSKHLGWMSSAANERSWDLGISYYGDTEQRYAIDADYYTACKGGKWDGLFDFFTKFADIIDQYEYIWLPDDDIETDGAAIEQLFELAAEHDLQLAQPSLTRSSIYSYGITRNVPGLTLRRTNFVELMAPLMNRSFFAQALPMFEGRPTGRTLDWVWPKMVDNRRSQVAIIDGVAVGHYRPLQKHLWGNLARLGLNPDDEKKLTKQALGARFVIPQTHGAITAEGNRIGRMGFYLKRLFG